MMRVFKFYFEQSLAFFVLHFLPGQEQSFFKEFFVEQFFSEQFLVEHDLLLFFFIPISFFIFY